jgi:hypothetical protein
MNGIASPTPGHLQKAVRAFRELKDVSWSDWDDLRQIGGALKATNDNLVLARELEALRLLDSKVDLATFTAKPGQLVQVTLFLGELRSHEGYFARNLGAMLQEKILFRSVGPSSFYLAEDGPECPGGLLYPDEEGMTPPAVEHFLDTLRLVGLLEQVSDKSHRKGDQKEFFFKLRRGLSLQIVYTARDLVALEEPDSREDPDSPGRLDKIEELLGSDVHRNQIHDIFKSAVMKTLDGTHERFVDLLQRFGQLYRRFEENYLLFISEFSFEKIREQAEEHRLKYTDKLNGVFTGIQNRLLAIPVALVIVAGQIKGEEGASLGNIMILIGAIVFAGLMWLLISNQQHTLEALKGEIDRENKKLGAHKEIQEKLKDIYDDLEQRYRHHRSQLNRIKVLVVISVLLTFAVFVYHVLSPELPDTPPSAFF